MDNPKSKTLFHFTKKSDNFYSILENGLKLSYCEERYNDKFHYALPMICFCDMPLSMIGEHVEKYGSFGLGFDKHQMIKTYWKYLNPVNYIFSKDLLRAIEDNVETLRKKLNENSDDLNNIYKTTTKQLGFIKPYLESKNKTPFYNESEWRIIIPDRTKIEGFEPIEWIWDDEEFKKLDKSNVMQTHLPIYTFSPNEVKFILVDKSIKRCVITDKILNMKTFGGKKIEDYQRYELLTKVVFLDEIKENF